jgi:hypothetical protein
MIIRGFSWIPVFVAVLMVSGAAAGYTARSAQDQNPPPDVAADPASGETASPGDVQPSDARPADVQPSKPAPVQNEALLDKARALAAEGSSLYETGIYAEAIVKFNQALENYQHPVIYFNLAKAYEKLAEYGKAADAYREYLAKHVEVLGAPASDKADTERTIELLKEKAYMALPEVSVDSDPRGAEVYLDGAQVLNGQTPMKTHLPEGTHKLEIRLAGYQGVQRDFDVRSREPVRLMFSLIKEKNSGGILVLANVRNARIHVDGNVVGMTPMTDAVEVAPGRHQVLVEKEDYSQESVVVDVAANAVSDVDVNLHLTRKSFSWRGGLGISSMIIGGGIIGASVWGRYYLNDGYKGTGMFSTAPDFAMYKTMVYAGYGVGAGLVAIGIGMVIWEAVRKPAGVKEGDLIEKVKPSLSILPVVGPDMMGIGAVAVF